MKHNMTANHKSQHWLFLSVVAFVLASGSATVGYIIAGSKGSNDRSETEDSALLVQRNGVEENTNQKAANQLTPHKLQDFLDIVQFGSLLERTYALYDLFANIDKEMFQDYWEQSQNLEASKFRNEIQDVIIQGWSGVDPMAALAVVERETPDDRRAFLFELVFHEWSLIDLADAMYHVVDIDQKTKQRAVSSIVRAREDLSYQQRREIARELDCEWIALEVLRKTTDTFVIDAPAQEWTSFVWKNKKDFQKLSEAQIRMLANLAYSWIVQEGVTAFEKMRHSLPSNFSLLETARYVSGELIETNPQLAFDLVLAGTRREKESEYLQLAVDLIAQWAAIDGRTAFDATTVVEARTLQLKLRQRVLWVWAYHSPESLLNSIEELPESLHLKARETALTYIAKKSPKSVRDMLSGIADPKYRNVVAEAAVKSWALTDLASTLQWIESDGSLADIRRDLKRTAYFSLSQVNPQLAVQTAATQPPDEQNRGWEALVIIWITDDNLDVATELLPLTRPGRTRGQAYNAVIEQSINVQDWERAINLVVQYEDQNGKVLYSHLHTLAREVPNRLYTILESSDSPSLKRGIALQLYMQNKNNSKFTDEQLTHLDEISQMPMPKQPERERSPRLKMALENFNRVYEEEMSD